mmetsp:Transcript_34767/g.99857  ORF Transcript_34767/g.99857 Transcript_34767/m.99857 type:complete len:412 (-) Transcript_34767:361-1596(-)
MALVEDVAGLLFVFLLASWLWARLHVAGGERQAKGSRLHLPGVAARRHEPQPGPAPRRALTQARSPNASTSLSWLPSCCLGRKAELADSEPAGHVEGELHPKWCGLRLREPSEQLPSCEGFGPDRPDASLLNDWASLRCADGERERCKELAELVQGVSGPKDAMTLLRFLRARKQNLPRAAEMYTMVMKWRATNPLVSGFQLGTVDASLHRRFDPYWQMNGLLGLDREGDCIAWECIGRSVIDQSPLVPDAFFLDHQVHTLVRMQQALDERTKLEGRPHMYFTVVADMHGLGVQHFIFSAFRQYNKCSRLSEDYFPELIKRIIIIRPPWIFPKVWRIARHFFDAGTRDKMIFLKTPEGLREYVDSKWTPESLGGELRVCGNPDCSPVLPAGGSLAPQELIDDINAAYSGQD